jgi:hypothetical protein
MDECRGKGAVIMLHGNRAISECRLFRTMGSFPENPDTIGMQKKKTNWKGAEKVEHGVIFVFPPPEDVVHGFPNAGNHPGQNSGKKKDLPYANGRSSNFIERIKPPKSIPRYQPLHLFYAASSAHFPFFGLQQLPSNRRTILKIHRCPSHIL